MKRWHPNSGTEGFYFQEKWCVRCIKDSEEKNCSILNRSFAGPVRQWVEDEDGPKCTSFAERPTPRRTTIDDPRQIGMEI